MTELELRLQAKVVEAEGRGLRYKDPERIAYCPHEFKRLGEIGSTILDECPDCGLVVGVAR